MPGTHFEEEDPEWTGNYFERGEDWERPVHVEYYDQEGQLTFSQDAGIRTHGGKTRQRAQKSLRLYARKKYGTSYFKGQLLPQKQQDRYKRFLLRTPMASWFGQIVIKDAMAHDIVRDLDLDYQDFQPVIVYLNGEYWGIHTLRDRLDEYYIVENMV